MKNERLVIAIAVLAAAVTPVLAQSLTANKANVATQKTSGQATSIADLFRNFAGLSPGPTPVATTAPMPSMAMPSGSSIASPSLAGLEDVASNLNLSDNLTPAWGTGLIPGAEDGEGAFRFICEPTHNAYDDPIIYPGQPGKSHLHTFFGNTKVDANSTFASLRTTGESSCNNALNRSAYWVPALMNGRGKVVMPDYVQIYYKGISRNSPGCRKVGKDCIALPRGLRYVFGYNMQSPATSSPVGKRWWHCDASPDYKPIPNFVDHAPNIAVAARDCPIGGRLGMVMEGPSCWNGTELDSPDHRSHMAYTKDTGLGYAACPATHPYVVPHFVLGAWYTIDATLDRSGNESADAKTWYLVSDRMPGMANAVPGTTMHSDWFGAWEQSVMDTWMANCIDKQLSCSGGDLGNGQQLKQNSGYRFPNVTALVDPPRL